MWVAILGAVLNLLPGIVQGVNGLFASKPKSGPEKLNAATQLALNGLALAKVIEPQQIGDAETVLVQDVSNALVKYFNARGVFAHAG